MDIVASIAVVSAKGIESALKLAKQAVALSRELVYQTASAVAKSFRHGEKTRDWQIDFGPVSGKAGDTVPVTVRPQVFFRGEKIIASDSLQGMGTRIGDIHVGQKSQRPANSASTLTAIFAHNSLGNGTKWDTCYPGQDITIVVSFVQDCDWDCTVFGKAILNPGPDPFEA